MDICGRLRRIFKKSGCVLCPEVFGDVTFTAEESAKVRNLLGPLLPDVVGILEESSVEKGSEVLCRECDGLVKESARLHLHLQTLNSQLISVLVSIKHNLFERNKSLQTKADLETFPPDYEMPETDGEVQKDSEMPEEFTDVNSQESDDQGTFVLVEPSIDIKYESVEEYLLSESKMTDEEDSQGSLPAEGRSSVVTEHASTFSNPESQNGSHLICTLCSLSFSTSEDKFIHEETVHLKGVFEDVKGKSRLYSKICGKSSLTPSDLSRHNETFHEAFFKFLCLSCNPHKKFTSHDLLNAHTAVHSGLKSVFPCSLCVSKTFETPGDLDNHILRVHAHDFNYSSDIQANRVGPECEDVRDFVQFPCPSCGFKARDFFCLKRHERQAHPEHFTFICSHQSCGSTFVQESHMLTCIETHKKWPGPFVCFVCNLKCPTGLQLREHLASKHTSGDGNSSSSQITTPPAPSLLQLPAPKSQPPSSQLPDPFSSQNPTLPSSQIPTPQLPAPKPPQLPNPTLSNSQIPPYSSISLFRRLWKLCMNSWF